MAQYSNYNIEFFEPAAPRTASTAPKMRPNSTRPNLRTVEKPRMTAAQMRAQTVAANRKITKIIVVAGICLFFLGLVIYSNLQLDEVTREIASVDKATQIAKSETVRLNMELDSIISLDKVEDYAANTLGMSKVQDYQVVYVDFSTSDRVLMVSGKETESANVIKSENE